MSNITNNVSTDDIVRFLKKLKWRTPVSIKYQGDQITFKFKDINRAAPEDEYPHIFIKKELINLGLTNLNMIDYFYDDANVLHITNTGSQMPVNNFNLSPNKISTKSNLEVWWMCKNQHSYKAKVSDRFNSKFNYCPICGE